MYVCQAVCAAKLRILQSCLAADEVEPKIRFLHKMCRLQQNVKALAGNKSAHCKHDARFRDAKLAPDGCAIDIRNRRGEFVFLRQRRERIFPDALRPNSKQSKIFGMHIRACKMTGCWLQESFFQRLPQTACRRKAAVVLHVIRNTATLAVEYQRHNSRRRISGDQEPVKFRFADAAHQIEAKALICPDRTVAAIDFVIRLGLFCAPVCITVRRRLAFIKNRQLTIPPQLIQKSNAVWSRQIRNVSKAHDKLRFYERTL